jgi:hypothetical protein
MKMRRGAAVWGLAATALVTAMTSVRHADAREEPHTDVSLSLLGGYGFGGTFEDNDINRYQLAAGGRVGVTLAAPRVRFGASYVRFFGGERDGSRYFTSVLDLEVGYDFELLGDSFVLRPELGLGVAQPVTIQSDNSGYPLAFHVAPGVVGEFRLRPLALSVELREDMVPNSASATTALAGVGVVF